MLTGQGSIESAVQAMKEGAYDYLTKPLDPTRLQVLLERALDRAEAAREVHRLRRELRQRGAFGRLVAGAPAMREVTRQIEQVAPTDATVLVLGESGTGKELVARTIHDHSPRRRGPVRRRQLRGDPRDPARERDLRPREGLLHGRHRTPPRLLRAGRRRHALPRRDRRDEPGDAGQVPPRPPGRALPARRGAEPRSSSTSASSRPRTRARRARCRTAPSARISTTASPSSRVALPPLRERPEDLAELVRVLLEELGRAPRAPVRGADEAALAVLRRYPWPGNVRELRNVARARAHRLPGRPDRRRRTCPRRRRRWRARRAGLGPGRPPTCACASATTVDEAERRLILRTLAHTGNNKTRAAEILGISLKTLHNKLNRYNRAP